MSRSSETSNLQSAAPPVRQSGALDLEALPAGAASKVLFELVRDELGQPLELPLLVARGREGGPIVGLTAALHGDEINGIAVIHRLLEQIEVERLRGTIVAVVVANVPAFKAGERRFPDGQDLNHLMPGRPDGKSSAVYAHRLVERLVKRFDVLVDLHTASRGRANSLYVRADLKNPEVAEMARLQRPQIVLHSPPSDTTLRGVAAAAGIPAITVEIGNPNRFQPEYIRRALVGLRAVLMRAGVQRARKPRPGKPSPPTIVCRRSYWLYTDCGGLLRVKPSVTDRVDKGQEIAEVTDIFGDVIRTYLAPERGVVIGHSISPVGPTGARILHLGIEAQPGEFPALARRDSTDEGRGA